MAGYVGHEPRGISADGWYLTGDAAVMDAEGRVHILGRKDDVIIRAGQKIHPAEIENCIAEVHGVRECAVVGGRKTSGEEVIVAYISSERAAPLLDAAIMTACRERLPQFKVPAIVRFIDALPRTSDGKVQRYILRLDAAARVAELAV